MSSKTCKHDISASEMEKSTDVTSHNTLVEVELRRKTLYEELLDRITDWIFDSGVHIRLSEREISHILLRYIFNKKATTSTPEFDPVFVTGTSKLARDQLQRDLNNVNLKGAKDLADLIDKELTKAAGKIRDEKFRKDQPVVLSSSTDGKLIYRNRSQEDFTQLAQRYGSKYYNAAFALGLRYSYICLSGHGFARAYGEDTKRSANDPLACEGFASAFNHYFDRYYSAFPDLEAFFGSRGCFFKINWEQQPSDMTYYLCPPFDESLMQLCVDHVFNALNNHLVSRPTFVFSIPGSWTNFSALDMLKASSWVQELVDYRKGKLSFIDHMATNEKDRIIYPTDICVITLSTEIKEEKTKHTYPTQKKRLNETEDYNPKNANETKKIKLD
jgi:hypothetical protein